MLLHLQKGETRDYLRLSTVAYRPGPTADSVVPGLVSECHMVRRVLLTTHRPMHYSRVRLCARNALAGVG